MIASVDVGCASTRPQDKAKWPDPVGGAESGHVPLYYLLRRRSRCGRKGFSESCQHVRSILHCVFRCSLIFEQQFHNPCLTAGFKIRRLDPAYFSCFGTRMTVESILEEIRQRPFPPVALETVDKTWIKIDREADIFIYDRMETACVVIFDPKRRKFVFTPEQISVIETR